MKYGFYDVAPVLPWHEQPDEDRRFRIILIILLLISLLIGITVSLTPRPVVDRHEAETIPPRLAKMIMERKKIPPPPPPKIEKPKEKEKTKDKEKPKEKKKVEKKPVKKKPLRTEQKQARKVAKKEIAQFSSILAELSELKPLPTNKKTLTKAGKKATQVRRELITSRATQSSGGVVSSSRASHTSSTKQSLSNVGTTQVANSISDVAATTAAAATVAAATDRSDRRSREQINRVFDQNKGALYALYNRALRKNPSLSGEVRVKIEISPEGIVTSCKVTSSDIDDAVLLRKLTARIKLFDFGRADVKVWKDTVVWDFIPS